jgi:hypothetical protein
MEASETVRAACSRGRLVLALFLGAGSLLGAPGCAGFWDDLTSRDFHVKSWFVPEDPFDVIAHSSDGDKRAKALRALHEPKQYGGTDQEQEYVLKLLTTAAVSERQPLCRLAAIQALGRFKDPRAVQGLIDAYYAVTEQRTDPAAGKTLNLVGTFSPEMVTRIQCQALTALGETGNPLAVELLTRVAREPPPEGQNKQQVNDVRLAATRALGRFPHYQATATLVQVLKSEKDNIALRDAAHESLQASTGRKLPADPAAWERLLQQGESAAGEPSGFWRAVGFFQGSRSNPLAPRPE